MQHLSCHLNLSFMETIPLLANTLPLTLQAYTRMYKVVYLLIFLVHRVSK